MPIKKQPAVTPDDFRDALEELGASVSEVAKGTGIPRAYLSDLKTRGVALRREYAQKLREYLESRGIEFSDEASGRDDEDDAQDEPPHPKLSQDTAPRCFLEIASGIPRETVASAMKAMDEAEIRLAAVLRSKATREQGFFSSGDFADSVKEMIQESFALLAQIGLYHLMLAGSKAIRAQDIGGEDQRVADVVVDTFRPVIEQIGFVEPKGEPAEVSAEGQPA